MKKMVYGLLLLVLAVPGLSKDAGSVFLIGNVPDFYWEEADRKYDHLPLGRKLGRPTGFTLAEVTILDGIIWSIVEMDPRTLDEHIAENKRLYPEIPTVKLKKRGKPYDVIYPGLIDLHNHTKQNVLPIWQEARGQFGNRWEWRGWDRYTAAGSWNMNPWIGYGRAIECAAFRWSELQALTLGTTYLQGPSSDSCVEHWGIQRVEDADSFFHDVEVLPTGEKTPVEQIRGIRAPTDTINPNDTLFLHKRVMPRMKNEGETYEEALLYYVKNWCDFGDEIDDVNSDAAMKHFKKSKTGYLDKHCRQDDKFTRYLNWVHTGVVGKKKYLTDVRSGPIITHLAEGRRHDPFNKYEFDLLKAMGLTWSWTNLVHAVGLTYSDFRYMAAQRGPNVAQEGQTPGMGMVWSPSSNFLLYGETADIMAAHEAGVVIAMGSDWTPTGTKSMLEELKIARNYVLKDPDRSKNYKEKPLREVFTDEYLFNMVTENAAVLMFHTERRDKDGLHGVGSIEHDGMGSVIAVSQREGNVFTNLVTAESKDINFVVANGVPVYGEIAYLKDYNGEAPKKVTYEELPAYYEGINDLHKDPDVPFPTNAKGEKADKLEEIAKYVAKVEFERKNRCGFTKGLVLRRSDFEPVKHIHRLTRGKVDLDTAGGIQRLLGVALMTQSFNRYPKHPDLHATKGNTEFVVKRFPALFSCNDPDYTKRIENFIKPGRNARDEITENREKRKDRREEQEFTRKVKEKGGTSPSKFAADFDQRYNVDRDY